MFPKQSLAILAIAALAGVAHARPHDATTDVSVRAGRAEAHHHDHHEAARLRLDHGRRWPTDAPLRQGMAGVQDAMREALPAVRQRRLDPAGYTALALRLEAEVAEVVAHCRLPADADAQLHLVLARLTGGIDAMKADGDRRKGALEVVAALDDYGRHFDHPGWKRLRH